LKEASDGLTEGQVQENFASAEGTATEKARDAKYKVTTGFGNRKVDDDRSCLTV